MLNSIQKIKHKEYFIYICIPNINIKYDIK